MNKGSEKLLCSGMARVMYIDKVSIISKVKVKAIEIKSLGV